MNKQLRQLTQKGDPRLNILLPKAIKNLIFDAAKVGNRRPQDEIIRRLAATIKAENTYQSLKNVVINQIK